MLGVEEVEILKLCGGSYTSVDGRVSKDFKLFDFFVNGYEEKSKKPAQ